MPFFAGTTVEDHCVCVGMAAANAATEWRFDMGYEQHGT
jgi:hypothetical protein